MHLPTNPSRLDLEKDFSPSRRIDRRIDQLDVVVGGDLQRWVVEGCLDDVSVRVPLAGGLFDED